jgi:hypothetical protein
MAADDTKIISAFRTTPRNIYLAISAPSLGSRANKTQPGDLVDDLGAAWVV